MPPFIDLTGKRFGKLVVLRLLGDRKRVLHWLCRCDCGTEKEIAGVSLRSGHTQSCGCLLGHNGTTHGKSDTKTYKVWAAMTYRCLKPRDTAYRYYGQRGITVCERWRKFENFVADMGEPPSPLHTLDRIDNDGNYEPGNVRWATRKEQANNTRLTMFVEHDGVRKPLTQWATETGIPIHTLYTRIRRGWAVGDALSRPVDRIARRTGGTKWAARVSVSSAQENGR